ncbi:MAG: DNA cytosine methyltransferase [Bifidobacterium thermophilum]|nr:DNA cytosine methyltransferase [Bifidobacterium thermophilum]
MPDQPIRVIDLFAGPGGMGEGFSSVRDKNGNPIFKIVMSVEMERTAHSTLRLRAFARRIMDSDGVMPKECIDFLETPSEANLEFLREKYPEEWDSADAEAVQGTLADGDDTYVNMAVERLKGYYGPVVLIGGPPCQAYSLVGRARRTHEKLALENDVKQTLYKCYLRFIEVIKPAAFVMENVKGLLSAKNFGEGVFGHISADMEALGYDLHSFVTADPETPHDFIVRADQFGIPQARHRVILFGTRREDGSVTPGTLASKQIVTVGQVLGRMPRIRSGFSARVHAELDWHDYVVAAAKRLLATPEGAALTDQLQPVIDGQGLPDTQSARRIESERDKNPLDGWYRSHLGDSDILTEHIARNHMASDLDRYLYCAAFAQRFDRSAKLYDFPKALLPNHKNAAGAAEGKEVVFADRFHVQQADSPSTTVTSHISKDGHYFIHPDPLQCRSLTVREAARLQTFPDDYFFMGERTDQYRQVGNAVPPLLALQLGQIVAEWLGR